MREEGMSNKEEVTSIPEDLIIDNGEKRFTITENGYSVSDSHWNKRRYELVEVLRVWDESECCYKKRETVLLEDTLEDLQSYLKNKYGVFCMCGQPYHLSPLSTSKVHYLSIRKVSDEKLNIRKRLHDAFERLERIHFKYRGLYDHCIESGDRETGAIAEYFCRKTRKALGMAFDNYLGTFP